MAVLFWKSIFIRVTDQECVTHIEHSWNLLTCFKAESLGACWISWREEFWIASFSVVLLNSGCWGVKTNAGWLHSLRKYCNAFKGGKSICKSIHTTNVYILVTFPISTLSVENALCPLLAPPTHSSWISSVSHLWRLHLCFLCEVYESIYCINCTVCVSLPQ